MRFLGMMLLMLLLSLLQLVSAVPASAALAAKESRQFTIGCSTHDGTVSMREKSNPGTHTASPDVIHKNGHTSVFYRLKPGIATVPRMNRTPKPKSVYRCFTRAPGSGLVVKCDA